MNSKKCSETWRPCEGCGNRLTACLNHSAYFACEECGRQIPIDKIGMKRKYDLIFKKAFGEKPARPENN